MDLSDDFFEEPPVNQSRAGGKFQPRAKQKPRKGTSVSVPPTRPSDTKKEGVTQSLSNLDTGQPVQSIDVADNGLKNLKGSSVLATSVTVGHEESLTQNETRASDVSVSDIPMWRKDVDLDQDPLEDVANTTPKNARAGGKFQPKAKCGPKKETSQPMLSTLQDVMEEKAAKAASSGLELNEDQVVQPVEIVDDSRNLGKLNSSQAVATDETSGLPLSDGCDYFQFSTGKSVGEAADIFSELESLDQFLTQSSGGTKANASKKSHDRIEMDGLPANKFTSDYGSNGGPDLLYPLETAAVLPSNNNDTVGESGIPVPAPRIGDVTEEAGAFPDLETEDTVTSGHHKGKFKPKTRSQRGAKKTSDSVPQPAAAESVMDPANVQFVPFETECVEEGSVPVPGPGDVVDHLSVNLGDCTMLDASMHEITTNEELDNLPEASNDDAAPSEDVPRMPEKVCSKKGRKNASTASNLSKKSRENATAANNEHEDESYNDGSINEEVPTCSVADDGEDDDGDEDHMDSTSTRKRATRKSKKPVVKNEKLAQKRKKSTKELDQPAKEPPKKFPHSTRRKRRCVDKALLEADDIDFQRIAIKDLILLAEHKERLEKKEAKASSAPLANQSTQNSSHVEDAHNEESSFASEQAQESIDDPIGYTTQLNSCFLNYQSYMSKELRARWSKQDTELFYEAIRQFGTDMSMIQQLFPGRTRHQIKLKFKNEERRHPMRISEAVATRAKDHSHFEKVIKQLKQVNAKAKRGSDGDDSIGVMGEEEVEELAPEINGEATKTKKDEDVELEDQGADVAEVHSPLKSDESEDDADMWDSYKKAF